MLKLCALLTCILLIGFAAPSQAAPPDAPGTIYIDGLPCNNACQSYMAWSRQVSSQQAAPTSSPRASSKQVQSSKIKPHRTAKLRETTTNDVGPGRVTKRAAPKGNQALPTKTTEPQPSDRQETKLAPSDRIGTSPETSDRSGTEAEAEPAPAATARTEQDSAAASPAPDKQADGNTEPPRPSSATPPANAGTTTALAPSNNADRRIAILLVRPEIKSASDLANKVVAIDVSQSSAIPDVKSAIAAAGASEVQMSEGETLALIRVMDGEAPAAVVDVLSPEAAEAWNAGIKGFNILRIPLATPSEKAGRG